MGGQTKTHILDNVPPQQRAIRSPRAVIFFILVVAVGLAADLASKHYAFETLLSTPQAARRINQINWSIANHSQVSSARILRAANISRPLAGPVRVTLSVNPGVVFGLPMPVWGVAVVTCLSVLLVGAYFACSHRRDRLTHLSLALIMGGAGGNLYDRLAGKVVLPAEGAEPIVHHVRDFIDCGRLNYPWIFNVADVLLVAGVVGLAICWLRSVIHTRGQSKNT